MRGRCAVLESLVVSGLLAVGQVVMVLAARRGRTDAARRLWWWGAVPTWLLVLGVIGLAVLVLLAWLFLGVVTGALFLSEGEYTSSSGEVLGGALDGTWAGVVALAALCLSTPVVSVVTRRRVRAPRSPSSTAPPPPPPPPPPPT